MCFFVFFSLADFRILMEKIFWSKIQPTRNKIFNLQSNYQSHNPNYNLYQQADPTKVIWKTLQDLRLKANRSKWSVHHDAQEKFIKDPKLCLVAKGLNPDHQDPAEIKIALLKFGSSLGMLSTTTILYQFLSTEHNLVMVFDKQLYTYRGWIVSLNK